jgi:purine-nucleoside phosphorylase
METSVIYTLAQRANIEALTLLTVSDHILTGKAMTARERQEAGLDIMRLALETAIG